MEHSSADCSVKSPEVQRSALWMVGTFGGAAAAFGLAAEMGRTRSFKVITLETGELQCQYPPTPSMIFAIMAVLALLLAQATGFLCGSFTWCPGFRNTATCNNSRLSVAVALVAQLVFVATAVATILTAAAENSSLPSTPQVADKAHPQCILLDEGIFLTASILCLFATVLIAAYYVLSIGVLKEVWMEAYSTGPMEGLEMLSDETATVRVQPKSNSVQHHTVDTDDLLDE